MIATPFTSATLVKRRLTPAKAAKASRISSFFMPRWRATATAESAFETLCWPGIGRVQPSIFDSSPSLCKRMSKREVAPSKLRFTARTSAWALKPKVTTRRSVTRPTSACTSGWSVQQTAAP